MKHFIYILMALFFVFTNGAFAAEAKKKIVTKKNILFVRSGEESFTSVYELMKKDLEKYHIEDYVVNKKTAYAEFEKKIKETPTDLLILMDNKASEFALQYNKAPANSKDKRIGVALMGLNLRTVLAGQDLIAGISFEVPAFTLLTQFRSIADKQVKNVVVFYRKSVFEQVIESSKEQLALEGITLDAIDVEASGKTKKETNAFLEKNLKSVTVDSSKYDAVWVLLDSAILSKEVFMSSWIPSARENKVPFLSGVENFVSDDLKFCAFALTPNLPNLAMQAVQMVESILDKNISAADIGVEEVLSVNKILNMNRFKDLELKVKKGSTSEVKVIE